MKSLEQEAMEARRGAEHVQRHLLKLLEIGSPSVRDLAYAIKSRIKDDFKIVQKVESKRDQKPEYSVGHLRDIVGLRLVTLYRLDALAILPILLERLSENSGKDETNLFLESPLEEIKIYSVGSGGDAQNLAARVEAIFKDSGHSDRCKIEQKTENYTSIHMVVWARGKWNKHFIDVPIEIQVRTALEDVWSEMDHQIKYKKHTDADTTSNADLVSNCLAHLNVMKTLNDGLAQYGDQVKIQIDHIDYSIKRTTRFRLAEEPERRLTCFDDYKDDIQVDVRDVLGRSREAFQDGLKDLKTSTRRIKSLLAIDSELCKKIDVLGRLQCSTELIDELWYVYSMERALVNFEIGNRIDSAGSNDNFVLSQKIYLEVSEKHNGRAIVEYRLARVLYSLGQKDAAVDKMISLIQNYASYDLPENHWVKASAHRVLGFWKWKKAERLGSEPDSKIMEKDLPLVLEAARLSLDASNIKVAESNAPLEDTEESPRSMALNNMLFYVVEYLESDGDWKDLDTIGITQEKFAECASELKQYETESVNFRKLNTLRRVALWDNRREDAVRYATAAVEQLKAAGVRDRGVANVEQHVLRRCNATVAEA